MLPTVTAAFERTPLFLPSSSSSTTSLLLASYGATLTIRVRDSDDAIAIAVRTLARHLSITVSIWLLSCVLMIMHDVFNQNGGHFIYFIPMFIGSCYGLFQTIMVIKKLGPSSLTFVSFERRLFMQAQGLYNYAESSSVAEYESLPLMRQLLFWSVVTAALLALSALTQLLFYTWLTLGRIQAWHAMFPLVLLIGLLIGFLYTARILSAAWAAAAAMSLAIAVTAIAKACTGVSWGLSIVSWSALDLATAVPAGALLAHTVHLLVLSRSGGCILSSSQETCLLSYIASLCAMLSAQGISILLPCRVLPLCMFATAAVLFTIPAIVIANTEADSLASSRGYCQPLPLCKKSDGWAVRSSGLRAHSPLLGAFRYSLDDGIAR